MVHSQAIIPVAGKYRAEAVTTLLWGLCQPVIQTHFPSRFCLQQCMCCCIINVVSELAGNRSQQKGDQNQFLILTQTFIKSVFKVMRQQGPLLYISATFRCPLQLSSYSVSIAHHFPITEFRLPGLFRGFKSEAVPKSPCKMIVHHHLLSQHHHPSPTYACRSNLHWQKAIPEKPSNS